MLIKRKSPFTGKENELEIDVSYSQLQQWENGMMAQDAMPNLTPDEREFIMTGITSDEWPTLI